MQIDFKTVSQFATVCQIEIHLPPLEAPELNPAGLKQAFGRLAPRTGPAEPQQSGTCEGPLRIGPKPP